MSPITDKRVPYSIKKSNNYKIDKHKMLSSFLPSYIHSIDGSIMRLIIIKIKEKTGYVISHLHDSIQFSPLIYDELIESIKEVYCENNLEKIIEETLLTRINEGLLKEEQLKIKEIINEFFQIRDKIIINKETFNVEIMFRLE